MNIAKIIIDCERMKYPHTGLYHFCYNLGMALTEIVNPASEELSFYLPAKKINVFGENQHYLIQQAWHKLQLSALNQYSLWHSTHQDSHYFPGKRKLPIVLTIHDLNIIHNEHKSEKLKISFIKEIEKKIKKADYITFISAFTKSDVQQYIDLNSKPTAVIYNGCNINELTAIKTPSYTPSSPFLFTIGTIMEKKNFHVLPALLAGNNFILVIAGITKSKSYRLEILKEAARYGVEKRVVFTGPVSENDKQWYYKNCEAFVFPSLAEGFGLPVLEAMYFGKPVFLSTYTSLPEIGGDVSYYFQSFDKEDMQLTLKQGLQNYKAPGVSERIIERAASFSWKESAMKYLDVYRSLY